MGFPRSMRSPRPPRALGAPTVANLDALVEVNEQIGSPACEARASGLPNEEARTLLLEAVETARAHRVILEGLVRDWAKAAAAARPRPGERPPGAPAEPTTRELVESWVEVKEGARAIYEGLAEVAPSPALRRRLESLAREEADLALRLRALL